MINKNDGGFVIHGCKTMGALSSMVALAVLADKLWLRVATANSDLIIIPNY